MSHTIRQQQQLERFARTHPAWFSFYRQTPRELRNVPFEDERRAPSMAEALIFVVAFAAIITVGFVGMAVLA